MQPHALTELDALVWQMDMGCNEAVETAPQMPWKRAELAKPTTVTAQTAPSTPSRDFSAEVGAVLASQPGGSAPSPSLAAAIAEARAAADAAADLASLERAVRSFNGCSLKKTATTTVFADGVAASRVMFIGEAPGADEDRNGVPFCGVSGQLLDKMLGFIGLKRKENFYITNALFWRPPGNRQPTPEELAICRPFVEKHIALVNPKLLVLVGGTATQSLLNDPRGITRLRGQRFDYKNDYMQLRVTTQVMYHPSYLLRQPMAKRQTWADLLAIKALLPGG
jgi:DNA polymerase